MPGLQLGSLQAQRRLGCIVLFAFELGARTPRAIGSSEREREESLKVFV